MIDTKKEIFIFCLPIPSNPGFERGWGNGYVAIPESHPLYEVDYEKLDINIHCGLTYSDYVFKLFKLSKFDLTDIIPENYWVFGWDTAHWTDDLTTWPSGDSILCETYKLFVYLKQKDNINKIDLLM